MRFEKVHIPYGGYWSTPFCRWQGSLSGEHPIRLAASCAGAFLDKAGCEPESLDGIHFGMTVPQHKSFWGAPWIGGLIGAEQVTGPTLSQACATSARVVASAAAALELGGGGRMLALAADRISNGPTLYYPDPSGPGGRGVTEHWVWDNFNEDPHADVAMIRTAENIAARFGYSRRAQDDLALRRQEQYAMALAGDRAFQRRYMVDVPVGGTRGAKTVSGDEGMRERTGERVRALAPVIGNGTVTAAAQTHPADGNAGLLLTTAEQAGELGRDDAVSVRLLSYGEGRAEKAYMGMAPVAAAEAALADAGLGIDRIDAVKTHNPFAVNDLYFAGATGFAAERMNNYGSSLIFGHPQGPTGMRLVLELIEELALRGGGCGLFTGCAAGDSAAALVLKVEVR